MAAALTGLRASIEDACRAAGRTADEVTLIAVTKTYPVTDAAHLVALGVPDLGENRDQEAKLKAVELADMIDDGGRSRDQGERDGIAPTASTDRAAAPRWHFVGQLQTNKARSVVRYARAVHSVDRIELIDALDAAMQRRAGEVLGVFLQVDLDDGPPTERGGRRGGAHPTELAALADAVADREGLELAGLMTVAPLGADPRPAFDRLAALSGRLVTAHPGAAAISAGMSADFPAAIAAGATHLRIGSALLGPRAPIVG